MQHSHTCRFPSQSCRDDEIQKEGERERKAQQKDIQWPSSLSSRRESTKKVIESKEESSLLTNTFSCKTRKRKIGNKNQISRNNFFTQSFVRDLSFIPKHTRQSESRNISQSFLHSFTPLSSFSSLCKLAFLTLTIFEWIM